MTKLTLTKSSGRATAQLNQWDRHQNDHQAGADADELKRSETRITPADEVRPDRARHHHKTQCDEHVSELSLGNHRRRL